MPIRRIRPSSFSRRSRQQKSHAGLGTAQADAVAQRGTDETRTFQAISFGERNDSLVEHQRSYRAPKRPQVRAIRESAAFQCSQQRNTIFDN